MVYNSANKVSINQRANHNIFPNVCQTIYLTNVNAFYAHFLALFVVPIKNCML